MNGSTLSSLHIIVHQLILLCCCSLLAFMDILSANGITEWINTEDRMISLDEGWAFIFQEGIQKLINFLHHHNNADESLIMQISSQDYMTIYSVIYRMCTQKPQSYGQQLYNKYRETIEEYIHSTVLPCLRKKHGELLLRELVKRWENHKVMLRWLSRFFGYLDRFLVPRRSLLTLNQVGVACFRDLVYKEVVRETRNVVIYLIDRERRGCEVDRGLLKKVIDVFVEVGEKMDLYKHDFEKDMIKETAAYYSRKATIWILQDSSQVYMLKVKKCLEAEKERVSHYMHSTTKAKLLQRVEDELMAVYSDQLVDKPFSLIHL